MRAVVLLVVSCLAMGAVVADPSSDEAARAQFFEGKQLYEAGQFEGALRAWTSAYRTSKRRELLVNIGQVHRKLGQLAEAREMYLRFLAEAPADDALRPQVVDLVAEIDRALEAAPKVPTPATAAAAVVARDPAPAPIPRAEPARHRWVWWAGGGAVLATAAVLVVALWPSGGVACSSAELGCIDRR